MQGIKNLSIQHGDPLFLQTDLNYLFENLFEVLLHLWTISDGNVQIFHDRSDQHVHVFLDAAKDLLVSLLL